MSEPFNPSEAGADHSSALTAHHGAEVVNYFSASPLNRLSFLRENTEFLTSTLPSSQFILFNKLQPLLTATGTLALIPHSTITHLIPPPFTPPTPEAEYIAAYSSSDPIPPVLIFLGVDTTAASTFSYKSYSGQPYWALEITDAALEGLKAGFDAEKLYFSTSRTLLTLPAAEASVLAQARHLMHWSTMNPFCSACGQRTLLVHAGTKRVCPPTDRGVDRAPCTVRVGVHNPAFPRTDPTVIMAIVNAAGTHVLLGHNKRWPKGFWSCLAGFCEPGESVEGAVRRETWEESGVRVGRVVLHSSQPWPYPACLMLGAVGEATGGEGEVVYLGHDEELEDAKWVEIGEVREALENAGEEVLEGGEGELRLPPRTAIAHQLLLAVTKGWHKAKI